MVKVSVIVPVYNTETMLKTCVESLIHQTLREIEIIFVNDGSTDGSYEVLHQYQKQDDRIHIICNEKNMGEAASRNRGLAAVQGKYVQFVDSDDYIDLDTIENLYSIAELYDADMCYLGMQLHAEKDMDISRVQQGVQGNYPGVYNGKELIEKFIEQKEFFLYLCSVFYKNAFIKENQLTFKKLSIGLGGDFILRALCYAEKVSVCSEKYYHYRIHGNSIMHSVNAKKELLRGQIVQYIDVLQYFSQCENAAVLSVFLEDLYKKIAGGIQNLSLDERKEVEDGLETAYGKHVFRMLQQEQHIYGIQFDEYILSKIQKKPKVIVYGAGYASKEILDLIHQYEIEIVGFAVTKRKKSNQNLYGHHVYEIQELQEHKDTAVVLVASNKIYNHEIEMTLNQYGFGDYVFLNVEI